MIYCKKCGQLLKKDDLFCAVCGTKNENALRHKNDMFENRGDVFEKKTIDKTEEDPYEALLKKYPFMHQMEDDDVLPEKKGDQQINKRNDMDTSYIDDFFMKKEKSKTSHKLDEDPFESLVKKYSNTHKEETLHTSQGKTFDTQEDSFNAFYKEKANPAEQRSNMEDSKEEDPYETLYEKYPFMKETGENNGIKNHSEHHAIKDDFSYYNTDKLKNRDDATKNDSIDQHHSFEHDVQDDLFANFNYAFNDVQKNDALNNKKESNSFFDTMEDQGAHHLRNKKADEVEEDPYQSFMKNNPFMNNTFEKSVKENPVNPVKEDPSSLFHKETKDIEKEPVEEDPFEALLQKYPFMHSQFDKQEPDIKQNEGQATSKSIFPKTDLNNDEIPFNTPNMKKNKRNNEKMKDEEVHDARMEKYPFMQSYDKEVKDNAATHKTRKEEKQPKSNNVTNGEAVYYDYTNEIFNQVASTNENTSQQSTEYTEGSDDPYETLMKKYPFIKPVDYKKDQEKSKESKNNKDKRNDLDLLKEEKSDPSTEGAGFSLITKEAVQEEQRSNSFPLFLKKFDKKKLIGVGLGFVTFILLCCFVFSLFNNQEKTVSAKGMDYSIAPVFYEDGKNGSKNLYYPASDKHVVVDNMDEAPLLINHSLMYYTINGELFYQQSGNKPKKINSNVSIYKIFNEGNTLIYLKGGQMYLSDGKSKGSIIFKNQPIEGSIYINKKETLLAKLFDGVLSVSNDKKTFKEIDQNVIKVLFLLDKATYYIKQEEEGSYAVCKADDLGGKEKLFSISQYEDLLYSIEKPDGKFICKDVNGKLLFYNGRKVKEIISGVEKFVSNINNDQITSIRCWFLGSDENYYIFDEKIEKVNTLPSPVVDQSDNFDTIACLDELGHLEVYKFNKKGWDKTKTVVDNVHLVQVSKDGKRIVYKDLNETLYYVEVGKTPKEIASNYDSEKISEDFNVIVYLKNNTLFYSRSGNMPKEVQGGVADMDISSDGKIVLFTDANKTLYIYKGEKEPLIIKQSVEIPFHYDGKIIYCLDSTGELIKYDPNTLKHKVIARNVTNFEQCNFTIKE